MTSYSSNTIGSNYICQYGLSLAIYLFHPHFHNCSIFLALIFNKLIIQPNVSSSTIYHISQYYQYLQYFQYNCTISHYLLLALHVLSLQPFSVTFSQYTGLFIFICIIICDFVCFLHHVLCFLFSVDLLSFAVLEPLLQQSVIHLYQFLHQSYVDQLFYTFLVSMH